ncbi:MAG TPA: FAD:protein FMN transferase [Candidatus Saccharimonadales bacterium]|nr:FAD:protein FMN transferase [Candidatus Saccharimonadales bacterium]
MQYYQENIALGSKTGISLVSRKSPEEISALYNLLWKDIFLFERRFSRFITDSELSMFNKNAGLKQFISPQFKKLLESCVDLAKLTDNLYNPFILPALQTAGYKHSRVPGFENDQVDDHSNRAVVTIDKLNIGNNWAQIPYGTALDLGGCGKGYLAEMLVQKLPEYITGYWLSLGGDIAVGGKDESNSPWDVTVESAEDMNLNIGVISPTGKCGIATSGTIVHNGRASGSKWHHIIDPRTNLPAKTDILLATVEHRSPLRADVLASCAVILGSKQAIRFLKAQKVKSAILQYKLKSGQIKTIKYGAINISKEVYV